MIEAKNILWPNEKELIFRSQKYDVICNRFFCFLKSNKSGLCKTHERRWRRNRNIMLLPFRVIKWLYIKQLPVAQATQATNKTKQVEPYQWMQE